MINEGRQHVSISPSIAHVLGVFFRLHGKQGEMICWGTVFLFWIFYHA